VKEIWRDIKDYEGIYQVSSLGKIKRLSILNDNGYRKAILQEKELKLFLGNTGYLMVNLYKDKKPHKKLVHRIVAETFIDNVNKVKYVNHIDSNKLNNKVNNLEWVSNIENNLHRFLEINTSSNYSGVCWDKNKSKWRAYIFIGGKLKHLGYSKDEKDAYHLRVKYEKENNIINKYL
jgi:hypothetical protein